jgi:hypothetical protein
MPSYLITYDLRKQRNYKSLYECLAQWKAVSLLESVWLADLKGPTSEIRRILLDHVDSDDGLAIVELKSQFDWATRQVPAAASQWLKARSP